MEEKLVILAMLDTATDHMQEVWSAEVKERRPELVSKSGFNPRSIAEFIGTREIIDKLIAGIEEYIGDRDIGIAAINLVDYVENYAKETISLAFAAVDAGTFPYLEPPKV
jgi:hypothetical protein